MFLGTPRAHKGIQELFIAIEKINDPDVILVLVGADSSIQSHIDNMKSNQDRVVVFPKIPFKDIPEYLAVADILVIPQRRTTDTEGQIPAKLFDAMAMAKPIITTPISDIPEVLGENGFFVEPEDPDQLANTIEYIFSHPEEALLKGKKARERCKELYDLKVLEKELNLQIENLELRQS